MFGRKLRKHYSCRASTEIEKSPQNYIDRPFVTITASPILTSPKYANYPRSSRSPRRTTTTVGRSPSRSPRSRTPGTHPLETIPNLDDRQIVELLASQPSPEVILAILPTPALQARMSELLDRNKSATLSQSEAVELDRYLLLEHWVRLAKAHAYKNLQTAA